MAWNHSGRVAAGQCAHFVPEPVKNLDFPFLIVGGQTGVSPHHLKGLVPHEMHHVIQQNPTLNKARGQGMTEVVKPHIPEARLVRARARPAWPAPGRTGGRFGPRRSWS